MAIVYTHKDGYVMVEIRNVHTVNNGSALVMTRQTYLDLSDAMREFELSEGIAYAISEHSYDRLRELLRERFLFEQKDNNDV